MGTELGRVRVHAKGARVLAEGGGVRVSGVEG